MKISDNEQRILAFITGRADATANTISKALGIKTHSVHYSLRRFHESKLIRRRVFVDTYQIGILRFGLYMQLTPKGFSNLPKMMSYLKGHESVALVLLFHGTFDIEVNIAGSDSFCVKKFLDEFTQAFPACIHRQTFATQLFHSAFAGKGYSARKTPERQLYYGGQIGNLEIDEIDHLILHRLCEDKESTPRTISMELGIPNSTFQYRIRKLKESGIIRGFTYVADTQKMGKRLYLFLIYTSEQTESLRKQIEQFAWEHPHTTYYVEVLGTWQHEVGVRVEKPDAVDSVRNDLAQAFREKVTHIDILSSSGPDYYVCDYPFKTFPLEI